MQHFADLFRRLDTTNKTLAKLAALKDYFSTAEPADAAWAVSLLTGRKIKRLIPSPLLRSWAAKAAGIPDWLFEESYEVVGDLAETIALLLPPPEATSDRPLHRWIEETLLPLRGADPAQQRLTLLDSWLQLDRDERFVLNKLLTGEFRIGVSQGLVQRALAEIAQLPVSTIAHRLMGHWEPTPDFYRGLVSQAGSEKAMISRPYPFCLAHPWEAEVETLGPIEDWLFEWKWDGIRAQVIRRQGESFIWSRGEELITDRFPEIARLAETLPNGTVIDGEIVGFRENAILPFQALQKRIGRKTLGKKLLAEVPAALIAFDLLEWDGVDQRRVLLNDRRCRLKDLLKTPALDDIAVRLSPEVTTENWKLLATEREHSREMNAEGLMMKRRDSIYETGRARGLWWKWKVTPFTVDAVLIYAQRGHGRRASLYTDYTFAVWQGDQLVPFAKAYSGLTDAEIRKVDRFVRQHTIEKFGPVRHVEQRLVMELAFENIARSTRHKSGVAVRFPRIVRWRHDKTPEQADSLASITELLPEP